MENKEKDYNEEIYKLSDKLEITPFECNSFQKIFSSIDSDKNGYIDKYELRKVLQSVGENPTLSDVEKIIYDAEHLVKDGKLDFMEFATYMKSLRKDAQLKHHELMEAFKVFDKNGNGTIDKQELIETLTTLGETMSEDEINEMIIMADTDGDGQISYEEFVIMLSK